MKITTSRYALIFDVGLSFILFSNASKDTWNNPKHAADTVTRTVLCNPLLRARALWHRSCSARAVIRKYCFWCFVNSESSRTRLSCRDSETVVIERLPSDNLRLSLILVDGINASPSAKTRMGSPHLSASLVRGCVVDSDMMELGKCSLVGGYQLSKTLNERKHKCF